MSPIVYANREKALMFLWSDMAEADPTRELTANRLTPCDHANSSRQHQRSTGAVQTICWIWSDARLRAGWM